MQSAPIQALSHAPKPARKWHTRPWYVVCLALTLPSVAYACFLMYSLHDSSGRARRMLLLGSYGILFQIVLSLLPAVLYSMFGRIPHREKAILLVLGWAGTFGTAMAMCLALMMGN